MPKREDLSSLFGFLSEVPLLAFVRGGWLYHSFLLRALHSSAVISHISVGNRPET
jgi:hypothetical protein